MDKYINYSAEDFAQDTNFIKWVKKGTDQKKWENFVQENPGLSKEIGIAKKIVTVLSFSPTELREADEYETYENIETYYTQRHLSKRVVRFKKVLQYAAIFILVISVGVVVLYQKAGKSRLPGTEIVSLPANSKEAKLILSDGEEILLNKKQTDLQFSASGKQIKIDQDSIINYDRKTDKGAMARIVIPYGKRSTLLLSDGTKVWLNAGSILTFPQKFSGKTRKVFLKGEAYFDVFKNKENPFVVSTDHMNVTVLGTEFNVRDNVPDNEMEVVLVNGAVSLKKIDANILTKEIKLIPNQKAIYDKATEKTSVESNVNVDYYISWKEGLLEFNKESILNVFNKLSRFYAISFVTESGVELNRKISGKLDLKDSVEDVMKVISDAAPITFRIEKEKVFVNSKTRLFTR